MAKGSRTKEDHWYHEPAFDVDKPIQRSDNHLRLQFIEAYGDFDGKRILDIGCNVGFFSHKLALNHDVKLVMGIDHDESAINKAEEISRVHKVRRTAFQAGSIAELNSFHDYDVALLLSVVPWILKTEPDDGEAIIAQLAEEIPVSFVELMYEGDGRAEMKGIKDDADAYVWLTQYWGEVMPIGWTNDLKDGVKRQRTMWKCISKFHDEKKNMICEEVGSQSLVEVYPHWVFKKHRDGKKWDLQREREAILKLADYQGFPKICPSPVEDVLIMPRIMGETLAQAEGVSAVWLRNEFHFLKTYMNAHRIQHHDIRPENLIVGNDGRLHLIDFGWATFGEYQDFPDSINPDFSSDDAKAIEMIIDKYKKL